MYHIGAIRIKERDYYGALHTFKRTSDPLPEQKALQSYAEAVVSLMKRKYDEGIASMSKIIKTENLKEFLGFCYAFRGYGLCATRKHSKAAKDFKMAASIRPLDQASQYNYQVAKAIVAIGRKENPFTLLETASQMFPRNPDPMLYSAALLLEADNLD